MSKQKGSKKIGQNKRKPTNITYKSLDRYSRNKKRKAVKHKARMEGQTIRVLDKWERGEKIPARTKRRIESHPFYAYEYERRFSTMPSSGYLNQ